MFKRISLKTKLLSVFFIIALLTMGLGYLNTRAVQQLQGDSTEIVENHIPRRHTLHEMHLISQQLNKNALLYKDGDHPAISQEQQKSNLLADIEELHRKEIVYLALTAELDNPAEQTKISTYFKPVTDAKAETVAAALELVALKEEGARQSIITAKEAVLTQVTSKLGQAMTAAAEQTVVTINEEANKANQRADRAASMTMAASIGVSLFAIAMGLAISFSVIRNIGKLKVGSARLASGDFSGKIAITSRDELGQLADTFNKMSDSLRSSYLRLALEKERDETLLESMGEGMVALDQTGKIVLINSVASSLLGLGPTANLLFSAVVPLLTEEGKPATPNMLPASVLTTGQSLNAIYTCERGASKILISIKTDPVKLAGQVAGAILILRDVTKEKEVDRMKTEFISLASHQLRTPLSAIKWFTEMLLNGDAGALTVDQKDFAKNISDSTDRMVDLVASLLNISRIESGRILIEPRPTDLKELLDGIVNDLKAKIEERQQTLIITIHPDLPKINLDPHLISQVYLNLLTNAIKYTPKQGEISVVVSKKGNDVISQVTDNGYGIPKSQQGRMFQKFFRAENIVKIETDGTGLGLYLIKAIVESSGGKIWFKSEEGKGTTFWFTLPLSGMKAKAGEVTLDEKRSK